MIYIFLPFILVLIFWTIKFVYRIFRLGISHKKWFDDKLVQQLALAARRGQTKKMDKLIAQGADINYQGREGMTILFWLLASSSRSRRSKRGFVHLLKQENIDPTIFTSLKYFKKLYTNNTAFNVIQMASAVIDSYYLKMILKHYRPTKEELNISHDKLYTALIWAYKNNHLTNFKMLLDYGVDLTWKDSDGTGYVSRVNLGGDRWPFVYYLLKARADYTEDMVKTKDGKMKIDLFWSIEDDPGDYPANIISCCHGIDYRQKVIDWLEKEKGIKLSPWMPKDQKYVIKDNKKVLMVQNKKGEWKEYKKTFKYLYDRYWICEDPIVRLFKKIWNTVYIGL